MARERLILMMTTLVFSACACPGPEAAVPCTTVTDCAGGQACTAGKCVADLLPDGGLRVPDAGPPPLSCDPARADNDTRDTDCDGLSDGEEYSTSYSNGLKTDPCNADTDGDGIPDGVELGKVSSVSGTCNFVGDTDPQSKTDPTVADTDGDGVSDGAEDKNHNGSIDPGESNPLKKDSDCDGISDGDELNGTLGCVSDPMKADTDGDGLPDGVEAGAVAPGADPACNYPAGTFDADPTTKTNACSADSDGDGVQDGAEDINQNGRVDPGELDPLNPADAQGPAQQACSTANLRPINFLKNGTADVQVALVPSFSEVSTLTQGGADKGVAFYDPANQVVGLAFTLAPTGATVVEEETVARAKLHALGTISGAITQSFTTWDGFTQSLRASYDMAGTVDLKARANEIAQSFLGAGTAGLLSGTSVAGPFKIQLELVRRTNNRNVVLMAIAPAATFTGGQLFRLDDVAGGSALAQYGDFTGAQCEVFASDAVAKVDFLWVVDNSGSMKGYQTAIANTGSLFAQKLGSAGLDWRVGAVTTSYYATTSAGDYRPFTTVPATMQTWFTANSATWFGTSGNSVEDSLQSARDYIANVLLPKTTDATQNKLRTDASLQLILLGDADDQSSTPISVLNGFFANYDSAGAKAVVHGIVCPAGATCSETQATPRRNLDAISASGGVLGDINIAQSGSPQLASTLDAILTAAISGTGHSLARPPISATIKIAIEQGGTVGACNVADVPRDRSSGFDYDSASRKVVFYGDCRPIAAGKKVAVSYKFWKDGSPNPNGDPCNNICSDPMICDAANAKCVCPANCGGCATGMTCDVPSCSCTPTIN